MQDEYFHETKTHGKLTFPYAVYKCGIPDFMRFFPLHWHNYAELIYVESGTGIVTVQSHKYTVGAGEIVIVLPQALHAIEQRGDMGMTYFNVLFDFSLLSASNADPCYEKYFKPLYMHAKLPPLHLPPDHELNRLIAPHLLHLINTRRKCDELMIKSELFAIMHYVNAHSAPADSAELSINAHYDKFKNLLSHIKTHYAESITVSDAAAMCWFSPSHFMKLFKELTGRSFTDYLIDYRLEVAARLLADTDDKIIAVAQNVGFDNPSYFSRAFLDRYGVTPTAYRAATRK